MRLIDADALKNCWRSWAMRKNDNDITTIGTARMGFEWLINAMPTIDAEPVTYGRWILNRQGNWACSLCGNDPYHSNMKNLNYCPNCGADMREVENG